MTEATIERRSYTIDLRKIRGEERARVASKMFEKQVDGHSLDEIAERFDASRVAVKTLIEEHANAEVMARDAQRGVSIAVYRRSIRILQEQWNLGIEEGTLSPKSMNMTKIPEAISNLQGRIDKLTGVEAPTLSVSASGGTLKDLLYGATEGGQDPEIVYEIEEEDVIDDISDISEGTGFPGQDAEEDWPVEEVP